MFQDNFTAVRVTQCELVCNVHCALQDKQNESAEAAAEADETERLAERRRREFSGKRSATVTYGTTTGASDARVQQRAGAGGLQRRRSSVIVRRTGSTGTTDQPFDRQHSSVPSLRSSASIRTRIASISRSEYHEDLKPVLTAVSIFVPSTATAVPNLVI